MLLFIVNAKYLTKWILKFKYISCYYSSVPLGWCITIYFLFKYISCYYSSSDISSTHSKSPTFKYISCYYSSTAVSIAIISLCAFKYISCYYSSKLKEEQEKSKQHLNTSHVIIHPTYFQQLYFNNTTYIVHIPTSL